MQEKILVGCPTSSYKAYCLGEYAKGLKSLNYNNFDILLVDNSTDLNYLKAIKQAGLPVIKAPYDERARKRIVDSRNILRQTVLENGYDYFLSLEQDVIPPPDIIQKLLSHKKSIVSGLYFTYHSYNGKSQLLEPVLWGKSGKDDLKVLSEKDISKKGLIEVAACGLGCCLMHKNVLEKIKFRFSNEFEGFDDVWFCYDAFNSGFKIYADTSMICKHLVSNWSWGNIKV
mgnify:CR=1 FL=1